MKKGTKMGLVHASVFVAVAVVLIGAALWGRKIGGPHYFENSYDRAELRKICAPYRSLPRALQDFREKNGTYPATLSDMEWAAVAAEGSDLLEPHLVYYWGHKDEFYLYLKLSWDGGLIYQREPGGWIYDPGDGSPEWPLDLSVKKIRWP